MRVTHLSLADFRNYHSAEMRFRAGPNLILGRNGQGKTNAVEAIAYLSGLSSHRVSSDQPLIRAGAESGVIRMRVHRNEREQLLELQLNRTGPNRAQLNRNAVKPRELTHYFTAVLFAPEDLAIVRGEPSVRRRFLDEAVAARSAVLGGVLADYDRVVRQRSALLKTARLTGNHEAVRATLSVWDERLVELGSQIINARLALVLDLEGPVRDAYRLLVDGDHRPTLGIQPSWAQALADANVPRETGTEERFRMALEAVADQERDRGMTLIGPHRDDLVLGLNGLPVKGYASHGESWSTVLALRLGMAAVLKAESPDGDPVLILDDVFAELDELRRGRLMAAVGNYEQVIVTAAVEGDVPANIPWHALLVEDGALVGERSA
ncbi:DNA replication/repair protein RecF [Leucobacter sp. M11]|uniref:DNA replication/repair protein RecF n=1 Tax=Leucobacter sp. M11 TaxID=2993565 RepID=UPI002D7FD72C|nr:DNA replication/repair protein RecF [Leucobacter sp. M11]MEB4614894.1 DNA replication/repair protein RecF [Leucobacter sp. M11]